MPDRGPWGGSPPMNDVTRILSANDQGDPRAAEELLPLVYRELVWMPCVVSWPAVIASSDQYWSPYCDGR